MGTQFDEVVIRKLEELFLIIDDFLFERGIWNVSWGLGCCCRFGYYEGFLGINDLKVAIFKKWDKSDSLEKHVPFPKEMDYKLFVLYDEDEYYIYDEKEYIKSTYPELLEAILSIVNDRSNYPNIDFEKVDNAVREFYKTTGLGNDFLKQKSLFGLSALPQYLFPEERALPNKLVRYTTLESFFQMINNLKMRMNAMPGMNDSTEGKLLDLKEDAKNERFGNGWRKRRENLNTNLIISFSDIELKDDLNQWRLYGDRASGICCEFEVDKEKLSEEFILYYIKYDDSISRELIKLKEEISGCSKHYYVDFVKVAGFLKRSCYKDEKEIRLLRQVDEDNLKWYVSNDYKIINAYSDFDLKDMPVKLSKVFLGPTMPNQEENYWQIKYLLDIKAGSDEAYSYLKNVEVVPSKIDCYR